MAKRIVYKNRIRSERDRIGYSLEDVALSTALSASTISNYEQGVTTPNKETWQKLADVLDTSVSVLQEPIMEIEFGPNEPMLSDELMDYFSNQQLADWKNLSDNERFVFLILLNESLEISEKRQHVDFDEIFAKYFEHTALKSFARLKEINYLTIIDRYIKNEKIDFFYFLRKPSK